MKVLEGKTYYRLVLYSQHTSKHKNGRLKHLHADIYIRDRAEAYNMQLNKH